ncbi:hypothetical protein ACFP8W_15640, partial [Nocardioides hankookensis]
PGEPAPTEAGGSGDALAEPAETTAYPPEACRRTQRRQADRLWLDAAAKDVTSSVTGDSEPARSHVRRRVEHAGATIQRACGETPASFRRFRDTVEAELAAPRFGDRQVDSVLRAWVRWGRAVDATKRPLEAVDRLRRCRTDFLPRVDVSYRIWWKWTDTGKAWWITMTIDNRTGEVLSGDMGGEAIATRVLPDPFGWEPGPRPGSGRARERLQWGGSSADVLEVPPGVLRRYVAPDADVDVHTTADGSLRVTDFDVGLGTGKGGCSFPVSEDL